MVQPAPALPGGDAEREMLRFETLTWVPIDRRLVVTDMLSREEREWLNGYHAEVLARLSDRVSGPARGWLKAACAPL